MDSGLLAALGPGMTVVVTCAAAHYIVRAGLRCLLDTYSRGLTIPKGAVPGRVRGSGHMAPTYFCRFPGSKSDGSCGSALLFALSVSSWPGLLYSPETSPTGVRGHDRHIIMAWI